MSTPGRACTACVSKRSHLRHLAVLIMWMDGLSSSEIAVRLKVTRTRANQMIHKAKRQVFRIEIDGQIWYG